MNVLHRWTRSATAVAAAVVIAPIGLGTTAASVGAAPARSATTYTDATYLQDALGLPATSTTPVIETVTYDRFQWLLKQPGKFAVLVGDPGDKNFKARAQDVAAAATAANVKKVYWFDPNLSGTATVGSTTEPGLDIRQPASITALSAASQTIYGYAWTNLVAQYLGDGYKATIVTDPAALLAKGAEGGTITTAVDATVSNDYGSNAGYSTKVGNVNGGALYGYTSGVDPTVTDDYFFIYNKDNTVTPASSSTAQPQKIVSWVDLSTEVSSATAQADVTTAIGKVGAANVTELDQSAFWQSEINAKYSGLQPEPASNPTAYNDAASSDKVLSSGDAADWRIQQITYPQLVHLLNTDTKQNAVILFGGTWCPNTRAVLASVNQYAIANDVKVVYNFDTVLDGAWVGGGPTSSKNPLQSRNYTGIGGSSDPTSSNPSFLYGDLISNYLANIATEYDPTIGSGFVSYYPGGNTTKAIKDVRKLQVPFLIGYQKGASSNYYNGTNGGITRQWIQQHTDVNGLPYFYEYMSEPYYTHPQPFALGLSFPHDAGIWSTVNADLTSFDWTSDPGATSLTSHYNTAIDTDDAQYLGATDLATVTYNSGSGTVAAASSPSGSVSISPASLAAAQTALGTNSPATLAAAQTALLAAETGSDATLISNLSKVFAAYSVAQSRKGSILDAWSEAQFGLEAVAKLATFFGGLPGGVQSTQTVSTGQVVYGAAPKVAVAIANDYGRVPTGAVALTVTQGTTTVASLSQAVAQNAASFTLPTLAPGTYSYTLSYPGDDQIVAFTKTGSLTVTRASAGKVESNVRKAPTSQKSGSYTVHVTTPVGLTSATGTLKLKVGNGSITKTVTGTVSGGVATVVVPKLSKGTWKVAITWGGDSNYLAASGAGASIKVTK